MIFPGLRLQMFWLRFPLIGGLTRLSKQQGLSGIWDGTWRDSEIQLCHLFQGHLEGISRDAFNNFLSYLGKSGDTGRRPAPTWLILALAAAVIVESIAMFFSLLRELSLAPKNGSADLLLPSAVAVFVGLTLLYFMYQAGAQAYRNHVIRSCLRRQSGDEIAVLKAGLAEIQAHQPQSVDDADPPHIQCLRRVGSETGFQSILVAAVLLVGVGGYATLVQLKNQERIRAAESVNLEIQVVPGLPNLPPDRSLSSRPEAANGSAVGVATDIALGILFLLTQLAGASIGYRHQLAAKQGDIAYRSTRGHATYEEYFANRDGLVNHWGEVLLKELQSASEIHAGEASGRKHHSFREFLFLTRQDEIKYDLQHIPHRESKRDPTGSRVESILARIAELKHLNLRADAINLIQDLPEPEKTEVKARLQALSAPHVDEVARRAAERQELEKIV